jgi:hypothetical protein
MSQMKRRATLRPNLLGIRPAAGSGLTSGPAMQLHHMLFKKGTATAVGFRPPNWSYDADTPEADANLIPSAVSIAKIAPPHTAPGALFATKTTDIADSGFANTHANAIKHHAAQQALAALAEGLTEMIADILSTRKFTIPHQA